ncbi:hypothetical protein PIB30_015821 [Stylosanthes scabra]|uniref:Transcription factor CBF/NF-Y/archaeal histone domain-containing protein n=1 Tax=Stylosanthes scabra TaxID=79078 RepID=A0ABU6Q769_9FABA|nr:hypothetical protein [Stylosanthes scabra]
MELGNLWSSQHREVEQARDFKNSPSPLARVRKMIKAEEGVNRISAEVPIVLAKACDLFIRNTEDFKNCMFLLARVKKMMKAKEASTGS